MYKCIDIQYTKGCMQVLTCCCMGGVGVTVGVAAGVAVGINDGGTEKATCRTGTPVRCVAASEAHREE